MARRPVSAVALAGLVGWSILAVAVWQGWLGPAVGRGGGFCEGTRDGLVKQPVNALSNLGFTVAGLAIASSALRSPVARRAAMAWYAVIVSLLGPASAAMHATEAAVGGHLDLLSMYLLAAFALAYAAVRTWPLGARTGGWVFVGCVVLAELVGALPLELPVLMHPGNAVFAILLLAAVALETRLVVRGVAEARWGLASLGTLLVAFAIWNVGKDGSPLCWPQSFVQGHGLWHLLCALAAYFLARHYLASAEAAVDRPRPTGSPT